MTMNSKHILGLSLLALGVSAALPGCGGSGSSSSGASFSLVESNVLQNQVWQINRPMEFRFSKAVDQSSVNLNTVSVLRAGGAPATGFYYMSDARTVVFQPTCPQLPGFTDAGLVPGGTSYIVHVVGSSTGGATVRSVDGDPLALGLTVNITTPNSSELGVLFNDVAPSPPTPLIWNPASGGPQAGNSYIELGGGVAAEYFERRDPPVLALGAKVSDTFRAPLNLYSDAGTSAVIVVELDQPVDPSSSNINPTVVRLQYCSSPTGDCVSPPGTWIDLPHQIQLTGNCEGGGATLRLTPVGILPQGRLVRVVLTSSFRDIVGNGNLLDLVVGSFRIDRAVDSGGADLPIADEYLEPFTLPGGTAGSVQDTVALLDAPSATWGTNGALAAGFNFGGTGGPNGTFDWHISPNIGNTSVIFNTAFSIITNSDQTATQSALNGQVDIRDLWVKPNAILEIKGPNPCVIRASGNVLIEGRILIKGSNNQGVNTFNTTNIPETGSSGNGGGGRGGTANILTTQSSPQGEQGYGAFDQPNGGGGGGETGYNSSTSVNNRRGGGGGGGSLGQPMILNLATNTNQCPDQTIIGLDSEDGSFGAANASGAISGPGQRPRGGTRGPRIFIDADPGNDFWGIMRMAGTGLIVRGEVGQPWPGSGGGGGGNAVQSASFPNTNWTPSGDEKGAGGGGGAGALTMLVLGDITFGPNGRIDAGGGTGGGGENTSGINRVGSASGGGSGGHVILQTAKTIDFRNVVVNTSTNINLRPGVWARGAQGGGGPNSAGGTAPEAVETSPTADRLPRDHYSVALGGLVDPAPCAAAAAGNTARFDIDGCGGDGGPGIIQLHAPNLTDIRPPTAGGSSTLFNCIRPNPVGSTVTSVVNNVNTPSAWNQLLPIFGRLSKAQSKWIALGSTSISPTSTTPDPIAFEFAGLTGAGLIQTTGAGSAATVTEQASILTGGGSQTIAAPTVTPYVVSGRTVVFDGTTLNDDIYLRNPSLLRSFDLRIVQGAAVSHYQIGSATYDGALLRVTVEGSGTPLASVVPGDSVSLRPRFFRVRTDGTFDSLPASATVRIEFQATRANSIGLPDESGAALSPWTSNVATLNGHANNTQFRFFRFRVSFDISADASPLTATTPIPALDFLRIRYRF